MKKIFAIIISVLILGLMGCGDSTESKERDIKYDIVVMAENAVKDRLKAPATAKFPTALDFNIKEVNSSKEGFREFYVSSYVDAQNSFGAKLRNNFVVKLSIADDLSKYKVLDVKITSN